MSASRNAVRNDGLGAVEAMLVSATRQAPIDVLPSFTDVEQIVRVLAYAELRAIMLAWARVPVRHPAELVRGAIDATVAEVGAGAAAAAGFGQRLCNAIRGETERTFRAAIAKAGPPPWCRAIGPGQLGEPDGLEAVFHTAGLLAGDVRGDDARTLSIAVALTDYVRSRRRARRTGDTTPP